VPKVSVYLPDELYRKARERDLPLSALAQQAIEQALRRASLDEWIAHERSRPRRTTHAIDTSRLMEEVRDEFGT
jgi:post-segregation antitoxin (ccd killing protein)